MFVDGRCSHPAGSIESLIVAVDVSRNGGQDRYERPALGWEMMPPANLGGRNDYWWAIVALPRVDAPQTAQISVCARLRNGAQALGRVGTVELLPRIEPTSLGLPFSTRETAIAARSASSTPPLVVICMATYNPPPDLLVRQIDSIREQTHENWLCVISDGGSTIEAIEALREAVGADDRFRLSTYGDRLSVYDNIERALLMVPPEADYIALSDQDDYWHPDKLEQLLGGLGPGTRLAYSDGRIIDKAGRVIDDTFWRTVRVDHTDFASLMLSTRVNIPGAAMLFESSLLEYVLPFPPSYPGFLHDFWIARVALALGKVGYVDKPLYDYVQHDDQRFGAVKAAPDAHAAWPTRGRIAQIRTRGIHPGWRRSLYFDHFVRAALAARALEARCGDRISMRRRRTLRAVADSPRSIAWLVVRVSRQWFRASGAREGERKILAGLAWRRGAEWTKRLRQHKLAR
jgi:glycosyltransferase involved in cell wall biosynthesis